MLADSHCHLNMLELAAGERLDDVIARANKNDVNYFLCVAVELDTIPTVLAIAEQYDNVYASVGIHPNEPKELDISIDQLVELASHPKVVAIGETGLDYYRSQGDLTWQHERFRTHIRAAKQLKKPLIIHTRDAGQDTIDILKEEGADEVAGVMHCFVDPLDIAEQALALNFYISFSGIVTFKNALTIQEVAQQVPLERILIETDSPFLAPVPYRGKPNEPAYVRYVAEKIAELRSKPYKEIASATTDNFKELFSIS